MEELLNQITELKADNEALAELIRLKEAFDPSEYHKDLIRGYKAQRLELQTEIKQLRDGLTSLQGKMSDEHVHPSDLAVVGNWLAQIGEILSSEPIEKTEKEETTPTDDEIHFVAVDESNSDRHGWQSLNQKPAYVDGFEDGAKWMRNKKTT